MRYAAASVVGALAGAVLWVLVRLVDRAEDALTGAVVDLSRRTSRV